MTHSERVSTNRQDDIDLIALWNVLWDYKYLISITSISCGLLAVLLALTATPIYRAEVVVTDAQESSMSGAGSLMSQLGGLASLAGVNVLGGNNLSQEAHALLKSRRLVEEFIRRHDLMGELLPDTKKPPTLWFAVKRFKENVLRIHEDKRNGLMTVSIEWKDPAVAARWANEFVALANELIRTRTLHEAHRNIAYLNDQLVRTSVVELERVIYSLIENETKTLMLANGRIEYAFIVIDPSVSPEIRVRPKRKVMVLFGLALGGALGIVIAFVRNLSVQRRVAAQGKQA